MIGLINYGGGNYQSVSNILEYLNITFKKIDNYKDLKKVDHIILPGVGSYDNLVSKLKSKNLFDELLFQILNKKIFYLGICVGMQLLSNYGFENIQTKGLGVIEGVVEKIPVKNEMLPNIGWHKVVLENKNSPLFKNIEIDEMYFYFVHSYYFNLKNKKNCSSNIFYEKKITASVEKENIFGVQFHPEKSQSGGLKLLKNFCNL
jgi:glutamine amidotransferase